MATKTWSMTTFYGGMTDDPRTETRVSFSDMGHFDTSDPNVLKPYREFVADETLAALIQNFVYANNTLYGVGTDTATQNKLKLWTKSLSGSWTAATNGESTGNGALTGGLGYYPTRGGIIGVWGGTSVFEYDDITGSPTFADTAGSLSATPSVVSNGIVGKDDEYYFGHDNFLAQYSSTGNFTEKKLILPAQYKIRSLERIGSYLAIGCTGDGISQRSVVFLWDYIKADPEDVIDCGLEQLWHIANLGGVLQIVSISPNNADFSLEQRLVFRQWLGGDKAEAYWQKELGSNGYFSRASRHVEGGKFYFILDKNSDTDTNKGIWSIGRKNTDLPFQVVKDIKGVNASDTIETVINSFIKTGDYFWVSFGTDGSVERTNNTEDYDITSYAETEIIQGENLMAKKRVVRAGLAYKKLPTDGVVTLKYKTDTEASFTTIFSETTDNSTGEFVSRTSSDTALPSDWHEITFRVESTDGAEILGIYMEYEEMEIR